MALFRCGNNNDGGGSTTPAKGAKVRLHVAGSTVTTTTQEIFLTPESKCQVFWGGTQFNEAPINVSFVIDSVEYVGGQEPFTIHMWTYAQSWHTTSKYHIKSEYFTELKAQTMSKSYTNIGSGGVCVGFGFGVEKPDPV